MMTMAAKYFCVVCLFVLPMPQLHVTGAARLVPSIPVIDTAILRTVRSNPGRPSRLILTERTEDRLTCSLNGSPPFAASGMKILQLVPGGGERYLAGMRTSAPAALSRDALSYFPDAEVSGDWSSRTMTLSLKGVNAPAIGTYRCDVYCYDHLASSDDPSTWSRVVHVTHGDAKRFSSDPPGFDATSETQLCLQSTVQKNDCCGSHNVVSGKTSTSDVTEAPGKAYEIKKAEEVTKFRKANQVRKTKQDTTRVTEPPAFDDDNISGKKDNTQDDSDNIKNIDRNDIIDDDLEHNIKNIDNDIQMNGDTSEGRQAGKSTGGSKHMGVHSDACPFDDLEWRSDGSFHLKSDQADYVCTRIGHGTWLCDPPQRTEPNYDTGHSSNGCTILCITVIIIVVVGFVVLVVFCVRRKLKASYALVPVPPLLYSCPTSLFGNSRTLDGRKQTGQETEELYREHNGLQHF